jgi:hypothetical protein
MLGLNTAPKCLAPVVLRDFSGALLQRAGSLEGERHQARLTSSAATQLNAAAPGFSSYLIAGLAGGVAVVVVGFFAGGGGTAAFLAGAAAVAG